MLNLLFVLLAPAANAASFTPGFYFNPASQKVISVYSEMNGQYSVDSNGKIKALGSTLPSGFQFLGETQAAAATALGRSPASYPETVYLAHRGLSQIPALNSTSKFPGNTKAAMNLALLNGYSGFEFDVQMTKDRQFMVSHDTDLTISTNCQGKVADHNISELTQCLVQYTGLIPEKKILHSPADQPQPMPTLEDVFSTYLPDPRVKFLVVDTKPGTINDQIAEFDRLLSHLPETQQAKLIFLIRDLAIESGLHALGRTAPLFALEGSNGWEPLQGNVNPNAHALSLSLGIGLGLAGQDGQSIESILMSLPEFFLQGTLHGWRGGSVDIASIQWIPSTMQTYVELEHQWEQNHLPVVGWTVNSSDKVQWVRENTPHLPYLLSDLPFSEIAKLQAAELEAAL